MNGSTKLSLKILQKQDPLETQKRLAIFSMKKTNITTQALHICEGLYHYIARPNVQFLEMKIPGIYIQTKNASIFAPRMVE